MTHRRPLHTIPFFFLLLLLLFKPTSAVDFVFNQFDSANSSSSILLYGSAAVDLVTTSLPSFVLPSDSIIQSKGFIVGVTAGSFILVITGVLVVIFLIRRRKTGAAKEDEEMEDWELEYWPHRMGYQEIAAATKGFSEQNVIGIGGNSKVYKGTSLPGGIEIAVKRISPENDGTREFLAEIATLGRLKYRNLAGLRGWCKREKGSFLLVYDYMENGSLDKWIFSDEREKFLSWEDRIRILNDVASGILYLHEGWESKVLHRVCDGHPY